VKILCVRECNVLSAHILNLWKRFYPKKGVDLLHWVCEEGNEIVLRNAWCQFVRTRARVDVLTIYEECILLFVCTEARATVSPCTMIEGIRWISREHNAMALRCLQEWERLECLPRLTCMCLGWSASTNKQTPFYIHEHAHVHTLTKESYQICPSGTHRRGPVWAPGSQREGRRLKLKSFSFLFMKKMVAGAKLV